MIKFVETKSLIGVIPVTLGEVRSKIQGNCTEVVRNP